VGLILAIALVYLLMVVLFQSWLDPFIVIVAVPRALIGSSLDAPAHGHDDQRRVLLKVRSWPSASRRRTRSFWSAYANDVPRRKGLDPVEGAFQAGLTRLRPV